LNVRRFAVDRLAAWTSLGVRRHIVLPAGYQRSYSDLDTFTAGKANNATATKTPYELKSL
jgi:hypothetical protein